MRTILSAVVITLSLFGRPLVAEDAKPAGDPAGIFGEFTLTDGERVIGRYHPEKGEIEVYTPGKPRAVKPQDIIVQRRLSAEPEAEPRDLHAGQARVSTLEDLITAAQADLKRLENRRSEWEKQAQQWRLEMSKREEGNKDVQEAMVNEKDRERKAVFAALSTEHLKAIATAHAGVAECEAGIVAVDARALVVRARLDDLQARRNWLLGRLQAMNDKSGK